MSAETMQGEVTLKMPRQDRRAQFRHTLIGSTTMRPSFSTLHHDPA